MSEKEFDLAATLQQIWRKRKKLSLWAITGGIFGFIIALSTPKEYTSTALLTPENGQKAANSSLGGLASMMDIDLNSSSDGISSALYPEIISSSPLLLEFASLEVKDNDTTMPLSTYILEHQNLAWWSYIFSAPSRLIDLFSSNDNKDESFKSSAYLQKQFVAQLRNSLNTSIDKSTGVITLKVTLQNPKISKTLCDTLIQSLERYVNNYRTAKTRNALISSTKMLEEARTKFYHADNLYAKAIDRNQNIISQRAAIELERLKSQRDLDYQIYTQLSLQVGSDKIRLSQSKQILTIIEPPTTPLKPSKPNTKFTVAAFALLAALVFYAKTAYKTLRE